MMTPLITLILSIAGILVSLIYQTQDMAITLKENSGIGILISSVTFLSLWLIKYVCNLINIHIENKKTILLTGYISFAIAVIICLFLSRDCTWNTEFIVEFTGCLSCGLFIDSFIIAMFLLIVRKKKDPVTYNQYKLTEIVSDTPNNENLPVTINKLKQPEKYFDHEGDDEIFEDYYYNIMDDVTLEAKNMIFEHGLENETTGQWYIARVDMFRNDGFDPELSVEVVFLSKKTYERTFKGIPLSDRVVLKDYCRIRCNFQYRYYEETDKFIFKDTEIELL